MEHPIIFSGESVRAILDGRKSQTRRVIKPQPPSDLQWMGWIIGVGSNNDKSIGCAEWVDEYPLSKHHHTVRCPFGQVGDRLWVRESWDKSLHVDGIDQDGAEHVHDCAAYRATGTFQCGKDDPIAYKRKYSSSLFMPRWASRLTLEIVSIRVERVQEISEADAIAEGVTPSIVGDDLDYLRYRAGYQSLWDSLNAKRGYSWESNPWVWVIEFRRVND